MSVEQIYNHFYSNQCDKAEELIRVYPDEVKKDRQLLWIALRYKPTYSLVRALIDVDPVQARTTYGNGYPLHRAIEKYHQSDIILLILDAYPEAAKVKHSDGWYPIYKAVENKCSLEVITKLIDVYEDGLSKEYKDDLPLHIAMNQNYDCKAILYLIEKCPLSAGKKSQCGQYPIHKAVESKLSVEVITKITEDYKDGLNKTFKGDLPLHVAIKLHYDIALLETFVKKSPQSLLAKSQCGHYPIELLVIHDYPHDAICVLLNNHKDGMKLFQCSKLTQYYKDMLSCFKGMYYIEYSFIANTVCDSLTNLISETSNELTIMISETSNDAVKRLGSTRNRDQSTDAIDEQSDDSSSIERKMDDLNGEIHALSIALYSMNDQMSDINKNVQELTEKVNMVENHIDEIRNERDGFVQVNDL